ncbi:hypothetical protein BDP81DRAFT_402630 [Colletotrichum phormii]|uniref:Uncharacterized protein n=1 Tax=Colletotrichum phormii TaxID=359342 RepID=A0AAJ0A175_9PEZI|nr:uncharacterized protein BDP81DRAFT_402630 [Colletotrichum phormii]KAK1654583.1 hypothetical protein BDP81DRAFT_402630 [Colletotrichum phormii]
MIHHCRCGTTPSSIRATLSHPMLPVTPSTHLDISACSSPVLKRGGRFPWANRKSHIRTPGMPTTDRPPTTTSARIALTTASNPLVFMSPYLSYTATYRYGYH